MSSWIHSQLTARSAITDVPGVRVGHATDREARTGVTAILFDQGAAGASVVLGGAASTRGFESLYPRGVAKQIQGVCFAGGSTFGLGATTGALRYLREHGRGLHFEDIVVPLVPTTIIFDLYVGTRGAYPGEDAGYRACERASTSVEEGCVGAGTGTTGRVIAGARKQRDSLELLDAAQAVSAGVTYESPLSHNTTLLLVVTDAALEPAQCAIVGQMAAAGVARTISPVFSQYDGDVVIALSAGNKKLAAMNVGHIAGEVTAEAIVRGVLRASPIGDIPCAADLPGLR